MLAAWLHGPASHHMDVALRTYMPFISLNKPFQGTLKSCRHDYGLCHRWFNTEQKMSQLVVLQQIVTKGISRSSILNVRMAEFSFSLGRSSCPYFLTAPLQILYYEVFLKSVV